VLPTAASFDDERTRGMDQVLTDNIWKQIAAKIRNEKRRLAAIAYVSNPNHLRLKKDDVLLCDASDQAIRTGETSAAALRKFHKAGVRLYNCPNLHAKVVVFGPNVLIGSCNLSDSSATVLREAALLSSRSSVRSQAVAFIHMAREQSQLINKEFIDRVLKIEVMKRHAASRTRRKPSKPLGNRTWVLRTHHLDPDRYRDEEKWIEKAEKEVKRRLSDPDSEVGWVRWTGRSRFRELAQEGDSLIDMNSPRRSERVVVSAPVPILKKQDQGKWTRFYYEIRDDSQEMSWTEFERRLRRVGLTSIRKNSTRELTRRDVALVDTIWEESE
jgi:hypothetical protein